MFSSFSILYSQNKTLDNELKGNIRLDIELLKDSISFGDSLGIKIKYKNISNNNINLCIPSVLFIVDSNEEHFKHGFDIMDLNKEMNEDIKNLKPNEEAVLYYKIILEKLDFLHLGLNKLNLNYIYLPKKKKKAMEGHIIKYFDLYII